MAHMLQEKWLKLLGWAANEKQCCFSACLYAVTGLLILLMIGIGMPIAIALGPLIGPILLILTRSPCDIYKAAFPTSLIFSDKVITTTSGCPPEAKSM
jgi:hypothetical protein